MRRYSFIEVQYRDGNREQLPPDFKLTSDGDFLWILDAVGPLYRRLLRNVAGVQLVELEQRE